MGRLIYVAAVLSIVCMHKLQLCCLNCFALEVCMLPPITNGKLVSNSRTLFKAGETASINFTCNTTYSPVNPTTTCQSDRTWNPQPQCSEITCAVPVLTNGYYKSNDVVVASGTHVNYQSNITPYCIDGYVLTSSTQMTCQDDGQFSGSSPKCTQITCDSLPQSFDNGRYEGGGISSPYQYNQAISPVCNTGFYLEHGTERRCEEVNSWSGVTPICSPITCTLPSTFINGKYNEIQASYPYGSILVPLCNKGHYIANNVTQRVCLNKNVWSGSEPICQKIWCSDSFPVEHGTTNSNNSKYEFGTVITVSCYNGYEPSNGITSMACLEDGTWDQLSLQCIKVLCNDTRDVEHEAILTYPQLAFGDIGKASYNSTFFNLASGSLQMNCSFGRRLSWITTPEFGNEIKRIS